MLPSGRLEDRLAASTLATGRPAAVGTPGYHQAMSEPADLFTGLAPVLNVRDLAAERALYEKLGLPVSYEGPEYPDFIAFGTGPIHFGIQEAPAANDPPSVLTWQLGVTDIDTAMERCASAGIAFELEINNPAPGWTYRRLLIVTPSGYRLALEGPRE